MLGMHIPKDIYLGNQLGGNEDPKGHLTRDSTYATSTTIPTPNTRNSGRGPASWKSIPASLSAPSTQTAPRNPPQQRQRRKVVLEIPVQWQGPSGGIQAW